MMTEWISVETLPDENMKVRWLCSDGKEDIGFFYKDTGTFGTIDAKSYNPITHWQPLLTPPIK